MKLKIFDAIENDSDSQDLFRGLQHADMVAIADADLSKIQTAKTSLGVCNVFQGPDENCHYLKDSDSQDLFRGLQLITIFELIQEFDVDSDSQDLFRGLQRVII